MIVLLIIVGVIACCIFLVWLSKLISKLRKYENERRNLETLIKEKSMGFPWLAKAFADYFYLQNLKEADYMEHKSHPAKTSADRVRQIAAERRVIEEKLRVTQAVIVYYQELFPNLEDYLNPDIDEEILRKVLSLRIDEPIREPVNRAVDPVSLYLSPDEYQNLSSVERNQRALDRYWHRHKSPWEVGRDYERYVGYRYEQQGYDVSYPGILERLEDLGRDLICKKGEHTIIVQCKRWAHEKTIHEKHINQLFGTSKMYQLEHKNEIVTPVLYTTAKLSDMAKKFADYLEIAIEEEFPLDETYPSIKCNISQRTNDKIYHLPFDQQYDRTYIEEERHERFVKTVGEAERLGFRRAWRWHGKSE